MMHPLHDRIHRITGWAVLALLLAVPGAAGTWYGEFATEEVQALGTRDVQGDLVVLLQEKTRSGHTAGDPHFRLTAEHLRVETDHSDLRISAGATYNHDARTTPAEYSDTVVEGVVHRDGYRLSLWPLDGAVTASMQKSTCTTLAPSPSASVDREPLVVTTRPPNTTRTSDATTWTGCSDTAVTIQGDLLLRLWEWDAELTADGQTTPLYSGKREMDAPSGPSTAATQATEQYLYAQGATLTIPRLSGHYRVYTADTEVAATTFRLPQATGSLQGDHTVDAQRQDVTLQGDLLLHVRNTGSGLSTTVRGDLEEVHLDGVAATIAPDPTLPGWSWWVATVLAVAAGIAVVVHQAPLVLYHLNRVLGAEQGSVAPSTRGERRGVGLWVLSRIDNHLGLHRWSRRHAELAHAAFPLFADAKLMAAVARSHLGLFGEALEDFTDAYPRLRDPTTRAMAACAAADVCCRMGENGLAREWLRNAAGDDGYFTLVNVNSHNYDGLSSSEWFDTWQRLLAHRLSAAP